MRRLLLLGFLASCSSPGQPFQDRLLATVPDGVEVLGPPAFTPDGRQVAYIARTGDDYHAVRGTWKSRRLDGL